MNYHKALYAEVDSLRRQHDEYDAWVAAAFARIEAALGADRLRAAVEADADLIGDTVGQIVAAIEQLKGEVKP